MIYDNNLKVSVALAEKSRFNCWLMMCLPDNLNSFEIMSGVVLRSYERGLNILYRKGSSVYNKSMTVKGNNRPGLRKRNDVWPSKSVGSADGNWPRPNFGYNRSLY